MSAAVTCTVAGCDRPAHARGWCSSHYANWKRRGDPELTAPSRAGRPNPSTVVPVADRFWSKVDLSEPDGCWRWAGAYRHQYGEFWLDGKRAYAHRVAAMLIHGELDVTEVVLHTCDNPVCVRPDHLRIGTQADNMRDCGDKGRWRNQFTAGPNAGRAS